MAETPLLPAGYLYVATGEKHRRECLRSVESLKRHVPGAHVTLVSDEPFRHPLLDDVRVVPVETNPYLFKIAGFRHTPYQKTFFVDTDTWFCDACEELFVLLDYYDWCIAHCPNDHFDVLDAYDNIMQGYYAYNTGVVLFQKNEHTDQLIDSWYKAYSTHLHQYPHDQPALMEALLYTSVKLYVLQTIYNARTPYPTAFIEKPVKIIHGRHRNYEKIARRLNRHHQYNRSWIPRWRRTLRFRRPWWFRLYLRLPLKTRRWIKNFIFLNPFD